MLTDRKRAEILAILGEIEVHAAYFKKLGMDVSDPGNREAFDIISRMERKIAAQSPKKKKISQGATP